MKINKIPHNLISPAIFVLGTLAIASAQRACSENNIEIYRAKIRAKANPEHFASIEKEASGKELITAEQYWHNKIKEVDDSVKLDSIARKAYFEGAQMVRDSINNISK